MHIDLRFGARVVRLDESGMVEGGDCLIKRTAGGRMEVACLDEPDAPAQEVDWEQERAWAAAKTPAEQAAVLRRYGHPELAAAIEAAASIPSLIEGAQEQLAKLAAQ